MSTLLLILDGFGHTSTQQGNAIAQASTPTLDRFNTVYPNSLIDASGHAVGLPDKQPGNSEVGHLHLGAGRIVPQSLLRINQLLESGALNNHLQLKHIIRHIRETHTTLHLMGLLSSGGVHSHEKHLWALIELLEAADCPTQLHLFLDGRDTPPQSALSSIQTAQACIQDTEHIKLATLSGRFWAMDRDHRWDRTAQCYTALTDPCPQNLPPLEAIQAAYAQGESDEFIRPIAFKDATALTAQDTVLSFNFRADRMHQLFQALGLETFTPFARSIAPIQSLYSITPYPHAPAHTQALLDTLPIQDPLGKVVAQNGLKQLRIAETEKSAHVTFFLDGGQDILYPGMHKKLIPSPQVKTYDLCPQMSAHTLTAQLTQALKSNQYDLIVANFANADMVGHTGLFDPTVQAIETLDHCLGEVEKALIESHSQALITADHGNAECMGTAQHPYTAHTNNPVPLFYIGQQGYTLRPGGELKDIAPTLLSMMGLPIPAMMTGTPLLNTHAFSHQSERN